MMKQKLILSLLLGGLGCAMTTSAQQVNDNNTPLHFHQTKNIRLSGVTFGNNHFLTTF